MGDDGRKEVRHFLRTPKIVWVGLGVVLALGVALLFPAGTYLYDRVPPVCALHKTRDFLLVSRGVILRLEG